MGNIHRAIQKLVNGNVSASDLQQALPVAKQTMCKHMVDAASCKGEDDDAASNRFLNYDVYNTIPKGWPERKTYSREPIAPELHLSILRDFLRTGHPEDLEKSAWVIEENRVHPHLEIKKITADHLLFNQNTLQGHPNYGIFATEKIAAETALGEYVGEMYLYLANPEESAHKVFAQLPFSEYRWIIKTHHVFIAIDGQNIANEMALINDYRGLASKPNVHMRHIIHKGICHFGYVTVRDIEPGEEILTDYGDMFWKVFEKQNNRRID